MDGGIRMANVTDQDGLMDFSGEDREDTSEITADDAVNIDYDGGADEVDDDEAHIRLLREAMELDESDYEDEAGEGDSGEEGSEEDDASAAEAFKNEENARNAERRRQEEAQRIEQIRMQSPELSFDKMLYSKVFLWKLPEDFMKLNRLTKPRKRVCSKWSLMLGINGLSRKPNR
jgi:hypothetical protein